MVQGYSRSKFEYFVVATIVALIALVALDRYSLLAKEAKVLRLEIISHSFMTAAANLRIEFLISNMATSTVPAQKRLVVDGQLIYVSEQGWPASAVKPVTTNFKLSDMDCYQLWQALLQNPAPIGQGQFTSGNHKYLAFAQYEHCRYSMVDGDAYFDYFPMTGRLLFSSASN